MEAKFMWSRRRSRRGFIYGGGAALASVSLAGCDLLSTSPSDEPDSGEQAAAAMEAPELAELVEAGELPPLEERLPPQPMVVDPEESIGTYGGEWHTCIANFGGSDAYENVGYDPLVRWDVQFTTVEPNIAESWEVDDDGRVYTFHLREGMKWSDGEPYTAADILFAYEDVIRNEEITPTFPEWLMAGGNPPEVEMLDEVTLRFSFAVPHGLLLEWLCTPNAGSIAALPKHYLTQFHAAYNEDAPNQADSEGFGDWVEYFGAHGGLGPLDLGSWQRPELPTIFPWRVTTPMTEERLVVERNPYYWKVDPDGRQLPYLDRVSIQVVGDEEVIILQASEGRYTLPVADVLTPANQPVLAGSREANDYEFAELRSGKTNYCTAVLNQNSEDPVLREIFQIKDFRVALSHAINREELIDAIYQRQGEPWQNSPRQEGDFYDEGLAKQFTEFDPERANSLLDDLGFTERDGDGFRLGPDGDRIAFTVDVPIGFNPTWPDVAEMIKSYWADIGVDMNVSTMQTNLFTERVDANQHDAVLYAGENGLLDAVLDPRWSFPYAGTSLFAPLWASWYNTGGESGEEPPEGPRRQMELYDQIRESIDPDERQQLFMDLLAISREEFYVIGTVLNADSYQVVQNDFKNVPASIPDSWLYPDPAPLRPEQFYREG